MTDEVGKPKPLCPKGHPQGTRYGRSKCGVRRCGEDTEALMGPASVDLDALAAISPADAAFETRAQLARLPRNLKGDEATKWAGDKLVELLPEAVASVAFDLRYGTDKVRSEAADKVLRANGVDRREAQSGGAGLIVLNIGAQATSSIPWLERMKKPEPKDED